MKTKPIKIGDDVKNVRTSPGARAGVATARFANKLMHPVSAVVNNVVDFAVCFWKGKAT